MLETVDVLEEVVVTGGALEVADWVLEVVGGALEEVEVTDWLVVVVLLVVKVEELEEEVVVVVDDDDVVVKVVVVEERVVVDCVIVPAAKLT